MQTQAFPLVSVSIAYPALWLLPCDRRELTLLLTRMLHTANAQNQGSPIAGIELTLVSDAIIATENERLLACPGPTNILSFPGGADFPGSLLLSLDTYARECRLYGQDRRDHLLHLLAHGVAHLAELEHGTRHDAIHDACLRATRA